MSESQVKHPKFRVRRQTAASVGAFALCCSIIQSGIALSLAAALQISYSDALEPLTFCV
jgi:hypothetical protein